MDAIAAKDKELQENFETFLNKKILQRQVYIEKFNEKEKALYEEEKRINEEIANKIVELQPEAKINKLSLAAHYLRIAGATLDSNQYGKEESEQIRMFNDLSLSVKEVGNSYAGYLTMNIYAGFTQDEVDTLYLYLEQMPHIKLALLPADNFKFAPLTDVSVEDGVHKEAYMFKKTRGSGDYTGATIVFDLTVAGAKSLNLALNAFIVPISIKSSTEIKSKPFVAELKCDFKSDKTNLIEVTTKEGSLGYTSDLVSDINILEDNDSLCNVKIISGSIYSAQYAALKELENIYDSYGTKILLGAKAFENYNLAATKVKDAIDERKKWEDAYPDVALKSSDFHWYLNKNNLEELSKVKFAKYIHSSTEEKIEVQWPTRICLTFDAYKQAYARCQEKEMKDMESFLDASKSAMDADICEGITDSILCGKLRVQEMKKMPAVQREFKKDTMLNI